MGRGLGYRTLDARADASPNPRWNQSQRIVLCFHDHVCEPSQIAEGSWIYHGLQAKQAGVAINRQIEGLVPIVGLDVKRFSCLGPLVPHRDLFLAHQLLQVLISRPLGEVQVTRP